VIVKAIEGGEEFKKEIKEIIDMVLPLIGEEELMIGGRGQRTGSRD